MCAYLHTYVHTCVHIYIYTYTCVYLYTYICLISLLLLLYNIIICDIHLSCVSMRSHGICVGAGTISPTIAPRQSCCVQGTGAGKCKGEHKLLAMQRGPSLHITDAIKGEGKTQRSLALVLLQFPEWSWSPQKLKAHSIRVPWRSVPLLFIQEKKNEHQPSVFVAPVPPVPQSCLFLADRTKNKQEWRCVVLVFKSHWLTNSVKQNQRQPNTRLHWILPFPKLNV